MRTVYDVHNDLKQPQQGRWVEWLWEEELKINSPFPTLSHALCREFFFNRTLTYSPYSEDTLPPSKTASTRKNTSDDRVDEDTLPASKTASMKKKTSDDRVDGEFFMRCVVDFLFKGTLTHLPYSEYTLPPSKTASTRKNTSDDRVDGEFCGCWLKMRFPVFSHALCREFFFNGTLTHPPPIQKTRSPRQKPRRRGRTRQMIGLMGSFVGVAEMRILVCEPFCDERRRRMMEVHDHMTTSLLVLDHHHHMSRRRKSDPEGEYDPGKQRVLSAAEKALKAERNRKASAAYYVRIGTQNFVKKGDSKWPPSGRAELKAKRRRNDPPREPPQLLPSPVAAPAPSRASQPLPLSPFAIAIPAPSPARHSPLSLSPVAALEPSPALSPPSPVEYPRHDVCWDSDSASSDDDLPLFSLSQMVSWKPQPIDHAPAETNCYSSGLGIGVGTANSRPSEDERLATLILAEMARAREAEVSAVQDTVPVRSPAKARTNSPAPRLDDIPRTHVETLQALVAELNSGVLTGPTPAEASAWDRRRSRYAPPELQTMDWARWSAMAPYPVLWSSWNDETHQEYRDAAQNLSMEAGLRFSDSLGNCPENPYAVHWRNRRNKGRGGEGRHFNWLIPPTEKENRRNNE
ncbi:hypothetical protein B0H16DRAFT_1466321 [Mycena metata]|uniref:Uncharacterized protein n=1 Tax=Mycena metata TaxID=1033252 RepID=A0AAD7I7V9_9AGAR|nr:hypothetical protein B0H16DRAFT_1466321 [Mycena metata]